MVVAELRNGFELRLIGDEESIAGTGVQVVVKFRYCSHQSPLRDAGHDTGSPTNDEDEDERDDEDEDEDERALGDCVEAQLIEDDVADAVVQCRVNQPTIISLSKTERIWKFLNKIPSNANAEFRIQRL